MIRIHVGAYDSEHAMRNRATRREAEGGRSDECRGDAFRACGAYLWNLSSTQLRARTAA